MRRCNPLTGNVRADLRASGNVRADLRASGGARKPLAACARAAARLAPALIACALLASCHHESEEAHSEGPRVQVAKIVRGTATQMVEIAGTLQPLPGLDVKLGPLSAGRLLELRAGEGDRVRAGQLLGRLDPLPLRAQVSQAAAAVAQARAQEDNARLHDERTWRAVDAGVAARQEGEDARMALATAKAQSTSAESGLGAARSQLARSELRAPFDGLVARVFAAPGEPIDAGKPVLEVVQTRQLELRAAVPAALARELRPGQTARLEPGGTDDARVYENDTPVHEIATPVHDHAAPAHGSPARAAQVIAVAPVIDPATGAATVRLRVDNPDGALQAGAFARAEVALAAHQNALLAPRTALLPEAPPSDHRARICVAAGQPPAARCKPVEWRAAQDGLAELLSGASEGELAIVQGAYGLPDGAPVRIAGAADEENEKDGDEKEAGEKKEVTSKKEAAGAKEAGD